MDLIGQYSSSEDESNLESENDGPALKRPRFQLPSATLVLPPPKNVIEDDQSLHQGRARSVAHEAGNWATFVYIPYTGDSLRTVADEFSSEFPSLGIQPVDDLHVSLTRTVMLRHHWMDDFVKSVSIIAQVTPRFRLKLTDLEVFTNDDRSRTFLAVKVEPDFQLLPIVHELDKCLQGYRLPAFYEDPSFHISFAWCLGDRSVELRSLIEVENSKISLECFHCELLSVQELLCKCGNKIFKLSFPCIKS